MKINNYSNFLLESVLNHLLLEANLTFLNDFKEFLSQMKSPVAKALLELENDDLKITTNFLGLGEKEDEVSFYSPNVKLTKYQIIDPGYTYTGYKKMFKLVGLDGDYYPSLPRFTFGEVKKWIEQEDPDNDTGRRLAHFVSDSGQNCIISMAGLKGFPSGTPQKSFIGRIARRILDVANKKFSDNEISDFVDEFKFKVAISKNRELLFELVEGEDIRKWYDGDRYDYTKTYTLHNSCMRYKKCQKYLDIYAKNPKVCKMLILKSPDNQKLIIGRALIWTLDNGDIFMDRIYYSYNEDIKLFKEYAIKNGWCYKTGQDSSHYTPIEWSSGNQRQGFLTVKLDVWDFGYYPYMDTLKYFDDYKGVISNDHRISDIELESTEGRMGLPCDTCGGDERVDCYDCDGRGEVDCGECDGDGETNCSNCDGNGETDCSNCDGSGKIEEGEEEKDCPDCDGEGKVKCDDCNGRGSFECSDCDGRGKINCSYCDGDGRVDCPDCT